MPGIVALGEVGLDYYRGYSTPEAQKALFEDIISLANDTAFRWSSTRARLSRIRWPFLVAPGSPSSSTASRAANARLQEAKERGYYVGLAGNVTYKNSGTADVILLMDPERLLVETDAPYLSPQPMRGERNAQERRLHGPFHRRADRYQGGGARDRNDPQRSQPLRSAARGLKPLGALEPSKKRLGQHFLKDPNTARIVVEGVTGDDVVLEVGPGRGFLTTFLAERAKLVYAIELDPDVTAELRRAIRSFDNVIVHEADALRFDYESLRPAPNKLVANLPYNVASPLVLRLLEEVRGPPHAAFHGAAGGGAQDGGLARHQRLWSVRRSGPASRGGGGRTPGLAQRLRSPPRVYSAVVEMKRRRPGLRLDEFQDVKELVLAVFKSRRKRLLNNLPGGSRTAASRALEFVGFCPGVRAEELAPEDFVALYRALSGET